MYPRRNLIVFLWGLFVVTFGASLIMAIQRSTGILKITNPYLYLIGPLSLLLGAAALLSTSLSIHEIAKSSNATKGLLLETLGAFCNGFAFWLVVMFVAFIIGLVEGPRFDMRALKMIASSGALMVYLYGWLRSSKFSWWGFVPCLAFLYLLVKSLLSFFLR